jgi:hypothetical protein
MNLSDFDTLALAQSHEVTVDKKKVGSGQARGFLVTSGIWKVLRTIQEDKANDLYALADAIIITASDAESFFGLDPDTPEGVANLAGIDILVSAGIMTSDQKDYFLSIPLSIQNPFASETEQSFQIAKGTIQRVPVTVEQGFCTITTSADTPTHKPQIYRRVTFSNGDYEDIRVAGFRDVEKASKYRVQCPSEPDMYVDNAYNVIS